MAADPADPLVRRLIVDEGVVLHAYPDSNGYLTIGVGRLIDKRLGGGITRPEAMVLLEDDIASKEADLDRHLPIWRDLGPARRIVLMSMCFQLGIGRLLRFGRFIEALRVRDYPAAANEMRDSDWWRKDSPARAERLAKMMESAMVLT